MLSKEELEDEEEGIVGVGDGEVEIDEGHDNEQAVETIEESPMARHDAAAVLHTDGTFQHALDEVAEGADDAADEGQYKPMRPGDGADGRACEYGKQYRHQHTESSPLPGLSRRVTRPHLVTAEEGATDVGTGIVDPHHSDDHEKHQRTTVLQEGEHQGQRDGDVEKRNEGIGRLAERLLAVLPQLHDDREGEEAVEDDHVAEEGHIETHQRGYSQQKKSHNGEEIGQQLGRVSLLPTHHAEKLEGASDRNKKQESTKDEYTHLEIPGKDTTEHGAQEENHIDDGADGANPKGFHCSMFFSEFSEHSGIS